jgi:hypothetical protein
MFQLFKPGDVIYGYCNGYFGRDSYETKTCVIVTRHYAVFEYEDGRGTLLDLCESLTPELVAKWREQETYD